MSIYLRLLRTLLWLAEQIWDIPEEPSEGIRFMFWQVRDRRTNSIIQGDIHYMKFEIGADLDFDATPEGPVGSTYEQGTAVWQHKAMDSNGNDVTAELELTVDPNNELKCRVRHIGTSELTALITLRADGDPDTDEQAEVVGTADLILDSPNVTGFSLNATPHV